MTGVRLVLNRAAASITALDPNTGATVACAERKDGNYEGLLGDILTGIGQFFEAFSEAPGFEITLLVTEAADPLVIPVGEPAA